MITIAIPTFNRKKVIIDHVQKLIAVSAQKRFKILIIDNSSPDGTFESLKKICSDNSISIFKNHKNLGLTGNFIQLFKKCRTEYLLITSDEDHILLNQLDSLEAFVKQHKPLFISPQFFLYSKNKERIYRGQERLRHINPIEFKEASFYMSGLVYKVEESLKIITEIKTHLKRKGQIYPLVLLSAELLMRGSCYWWDKPIAIKKYQCHTNIKGANNDKYNYLPARFHQHKLFVDYFKDRIENINPEMKKTAIKMMQVQNKRLFRIVRESIRQECPEFIRFFDKGALDFYFDKSIVSKFIKFFKHPAVYSKKIIKKCGFFLK
jgi:glycosyltransferase involved in cell wall biosynthesis